MSDYPPGSRKPCPECGKEIHPNNIRRHVRSYHNNEPEHWTGECRNPKCDWYKHTTTVILVVVGSGTGVGRVHVRCTSCGKGQYEFSPRTRPSFAHLAHAQKPLPEDEIVRLYTEEKLSSREIGEKYNVNRETILKRLRKLGVKPRSRTEHPFTHEHQIKGAQIKRDKGVKTTKRVLELDEKGYTNKEIAIILGMTRDGVRRARRRGHIQEQKVAA